MKKYIFALSLCLFAMTAYAQKNVYWIHGLNDNSTFWQRYRSTLSSGHMGAEINWEAGKRIDLSSYFGDYELLQTGYGFSAPGIVRPSLSIREDVSKLVTTNAILVGHSAGGLIARSVHQSNSKVKALVTVGTPNQGAGIITMAREQRYYDVIETLKGMAWQAGQKTAQAANRISASFLLWIFIPVVGTVENYYQDLLSTAETKLKNTADDYVLNNLNNLTVRDMEPGSEYLIQLNNKAITVPIINLYGAEDDWQLVRLAGTMANKDKIVSMGNTSDQTYDEAYIPDMRRILGALEEIASACEQVYNVLRWAQIIWPPLWGVDQTLKDAEMAWRAVHRYLDQDLHNNYAYLIQAYHFEPRQVPEQYLVWKIRDDWTPNLGDSAITGQYEQVVETRWVWKNVPAYDEHDGMVGNHSSQIPTYQAPLLIRNIEVKGVNHMEMSGHIEMRDELYNILHFGNGYDRVFDPSYN